MPKKRPKPGKCVHCLNTFENLTWDHVFPEAWYPETTMSNLPKWKIPSCPDCNGKYGTLENDLLTRLSISLNPSDPACAGIAKKGMRALDPKYAKNEKDRKFRQAKKKKIFGQSLRGNSIPEEHLYPNFGLHTNIPKQEQVGVPISGDSIARLAEKIVRGIFYIEDERFIEPPYKIESFVLNNEDAQIVIAAVKKFGSLYAREPGINVYRAVSPEDSVSSLFFIEIWERLRLYATVLPLNAISSESSRLFNGMTK